MWLIVPGGGPNEANVRTFAATTGFDDEQIFSGERLGLSEVFAAADLVLLPADRDGGVAPLARAMAAGRPIVATRTPDVAETAPDGRAARLVECGNPRQMSSALSGLIDDAALAGRLAASAGRIARERFSPARIRTAFEVLYARLGP